MKSAKLKHLQFNIAVIDGFELCKRIRALVDCPILFLTAKTEENSLVNGLSLGADDYISKPFGVMELRARINAHLRREHREHSVRMVLGRVFWLKTEDRFSRRNRYWKRSLALTMRVMTVL